jgi:hypothetical protein
MSRQGWSSYTDEQLARERARRKEQRLRYHRQKNAPVVDPEEMAAEQRRADALRSLQRAEDIERVQLGVWLGRHGHILWEEHETFPSFRVSVSEELLQHTAETSWLSGSGGVS